MNRGEQVTTQAGPTPATSAGAERGPVLRVRDLHVHRGEAHVLHGVDLDVVPHQVTALLGRNGVGKTTTLLALLGQLAAAGTIELDGRELTGLPVHERVKGGLAYVPEDREVFTQLTVAENLRLAASLAPRSPERLELVHELFPELASRAGQLAGTLSGGQQQMVAIGRALLQPAKVLLIDEPTKGLAPIVIGEVVEALERATREATVLLVEQNLRVAQRLATAAVVLDHGEVAWRGRIDELLADADKTRSLLGVARATGGGS